MGGRSRRWQSGFGPSAPLASCACAAGLVRLDTGLAGFHLIAELVTAVMALFVRDKEKERFYLLPGMGGKNLRRKRRKILQWSIIAGLFTSALLAFILYLISKSGY